MKAKVVGAIIGAAVLGGAGNRRGGGGRCGAQGLDPCPSGGHSIDYPTR